MGRGRLVGGRELCVVGEQYRRVFSETRDRDAVGW